MRNYKSTIRTKFKFLAFLHSGKTISTADISIRHCRTSVLKFVSTNLQIQITNYNLHTLTLQVYN